MTDNHRRPRALRSADPDVARDVLAEVDDLMAVVEARDRPRFQVRDHGHAQVALGHQSTARPRAHDDRPPVVIPEPGPFPARWVVPSVEPFAHEQVVGHERAGVRSPRGVGRDDHPSAAGDVDLDLGHQGRVVAVLLGAELADVAREPATAEPRRDHVLAAPEEVDDVDGAVLDPPSVVGPAGREQVLPDRAAIDRELHQPERGHVGPCAMGSGRKPERPAEDRAPRRPARRVGIDPRDPSRDPVVLRHEAHLPRRGRTPRTSVSQVVDDPDTPVAPFAGTWRRSVVHDRRIRADDLLRRPDNCRRDEARVSGDLSREGRLLGGGLVELYAPAQPRPRVVEAERIDPLLRPKIDRHRQAGHPVAMAVCGASPDTNDPPPHPMDRAADRVRGVTRMDRWSRVTAHSHRAWPAGRPPDRRAPSADRRHRW